ncbi:hypothetical protein B7463_g6710, partial [Scytalidium lignicola]
MSGPERPAKAAALVDVPAPAAPSVLSRRRMSHSAQPNQRTILGIRRGLCNVSAVIIYSPSNSDIARRDDLSCPNPTIRGFLLSPRTRTPQFAQAVATKTRPDGDLYPADIRSDTRLYPVYKTSCAFTVAQQKRPGGLISAAAFDVIATILQAPGASKVAAVQKCQAIAEIFNASRSLLEAMHQLQCRDPHSMIMCYLILACYTRLLHIFKSLIVALHGNASYAKNERLDCPPSLIELHLVLLVQFIMQLSSCLQHDTKAYFSLVDSRSDSEGIEGVRSPFDTYQAAGLEGVSQLEGSTRDKLKQLQDMIQG